MGRRKINWSDLPAELIAQIAKLLKTRPDVLHFRTVCKDWCRSVSLTLLRRKNVLSLILPHRLSTITSTMLKGGAPSRLEYYFDPYSIDPLILISSSIFKIKPVVNNYKLPPWLVTVEEVNRGKLRLKKPFSRCDLVKRPHRFPEVLDMGRFEMEEMAKVYSFRFDKRCSFSSEDDFLSGEDHKVLLMVETGCEKSVAMINDYIAVVLYDNGALSTFKLKDESVKQLVAKVRKFDDIVMFNDTVYVIDRYGKLYLIDNSNSDRFKLVNIIETKLKSSNERRSRLVEACGELYFVRKCMVSRPSLERKCMGIRVYKLNQELMSWDEIESIGEDRILFVTPDCGFFAGASDFCGWPGNCVVLQSKRSFPAYFHSPSPTTYDSDGEYDYKEDYFEYVSERDGDKIEVFRFEDCSFEPVKYNEPPEWVSCSSLNQDQIWRDSCRMPKTWQLQL